MKKILLSVGILFTLRLLCSNVLAQNYNFLNPLVSFGPNLDGSIRPGDRPYVTTGNFQRGVAYNPATGNIIFIDRAAGGGGSPNISGGIYVLDSLSGGEVGTLSTNGMGGGDFADMCVGVSDDGVVYVGNAVNNGTNNPFKLYRWESDTAPDPPVVVYAGDPGNGKAHRWGDTMDIRGSGTETQIILGTRASGGIAGTNVALLTTADGVNFTATTIATDVPGESSSAGGIAFGAGNTFWAKNLDSPLRVFGFDLGTGQATTLRTYGSTSLPASRPLEALAVNVAQNLLAIVDFAPATDRVRLYDIADANRGPVLLDIRDYPVSNANGTTTKGYLDFGGGNLYVHDMNNGLLAFSIGSQPLIPPLIDVQPVSPGRVLSGRTVSFEVVAYPAATYRWQHDGVDVPNATNAVLTLTNVQVSDAGDYQVFVQNAAGTTPSATVFLPVVNAADLFHLEPLWSAAPGAQPYVTSTGGANTPNERGFTHHALSNQLCVVQRGGSASANYTIHVIDAVTGTKLYNMKTNGVFLVVQSEVAGANGIGLVATGAAEDGAIYACNASPNAGGGATTFVTNKLFRVYRWADSSSNTLPVQIFEGDPTAQTSNFRWGDVLSVRGSGLGTQILLDNQNAAARYMAILRPSDENMTNFPSQFYFQDTPSIPGTSIGRSLQFGAGDTFWQKRKAAALVQSGFDPNAVFPNNISTVLATYGGYPAAVGQVAVDTTRNLALGIGHASVTTSPDTLDLYDITDPNAPLLLAQYNFPVNHQANGNFIGQVIIAGDKVFALSGNNGMLAFRIVSGPQSPPTLTSQPQDLRIVSGNSGTLSVSTADLAEFQWQVNSNNIPGATNSSYTIPSATPNDAGFYRVIVSNSAGSITSSNALVTVLPAEDFPRLLPCWGLAPQSRAYLAPDPDAQGRTPLYRGIAYYGPSNQVYVITRTSQTGGLAVNVLDATTGADLYQLNVDGISGGTIILLAIDVADDGSLYAANMADGPNGGLIYNLYRWANSDPATVPALVYSGDPGTGLAPVTRWGDTLDARGSGVDTEILIDGNNGNYAVLFKPTDGMLSAFSPIPFAQVYGGGSIGRSLEFGATNTFWQKRKGARLQLSQFDLGAMNSSLVASYPNFPASLGPVDLDPAHGLVAGINFSGVTTAPDTLELYDMSDLNNPQRIAGYDFPINARPNGNFIGQVLFAGGKVFAVDGNNGIVAFNVVLPSGPPLTITRSGADVILSWPDPSPGFVLEKTLTISPPNWTAVLQTPMLVNGEKTVTESAAGESSFYRLRKGP